MGLARPHKTGKEKHYECRYSSNHFYVSHSLWASYSNYGGYTIMDVTVYEREVYGTVRYYPVNDRAKILLRLTGTKTFTPEMLNIIEQTGYKVVRVARGE